MLAIKGIVFSSTSNRQTKIAISTEVVFLPGRSVGGYCHEGTWILLWVELVLAATTNIEDKLRIVFIINYLVNETTDLKLHRLFKDQLVKKLDFPRALSRRLSSRRNLNSTLGRVSSRCNYKHWRQGRNCIYNKLFS